MKNHYYLVSCSYGINTGGFGIVSFTIAQEKEGKFTSNSTLNYLKSEAKRVIDKNLDIGNIAVVSISYLGLMTEKEFNDE